MHATQQKRIYYEKVIDKKNEENEKNLADLRNGINIEGTHYGKIIVEKQPSSGKPYNVLKIVIFEGKNNEIRRVMWHLGLRVVKLTRVQYGDFRLNGLPSGCIQESRTPLHIRDLERRASANIKAYNKKHNIVKSNQEDGVKTKLKEQPTDVSGDKLQKINEDTQEENVKTDME